MICVYDRPIGCRCGACRPDLGRVSVAAAANSGIGGPRGPSTWLKQCCVCKELFAVRVPDGHVPPPPPLKCPQCKSPEAA